MISSHLCAVSKAIQAVNEAVDSGDSAQTLAALRTPAAGVYGVTSECAPTYQTDLAKIKEDKKKEGKTVGCHAPAHTLPFAVIL